MYSELVNEGGGAQRNFRPKISVFQFELHDASQLVAITSDMEEPSTCVSVNAFKAKFGCRPKPFTVVDEPLRRLLQN